jgi:hypothetical protein
MKSILKSYRSLGIQFNAKVRHEDGLDEVMSVDTTIASNVCSQFVSGSIDCVQVDGGFVKYDSGAGMRMDLTDFENRLENMTTEELEAQIYALQLHREVARRKESDSQGRRW